MCCCVLSVREGLQAQDRPGSPYGPDAWGEARGEERLPSVRQNFQEAKGHVVTLEARAVRVEAWQEVD